MLICLLAWINTQSVVSGIILSESVAYSALEVKPETPYLVETGTNSTECIDMFIIQSFF